MLHEGPCTKDQTQAGDNHRNTWPGRESSVFLVVAIPRASIARPRLGGRIPRRRGLGPYRRHDGVLIGRRRAKGHARDAHVLGAGGDGLAPHGGGRRGPGGAGAPAHGVRPAADDDERGAQPGDGHAADDLARRGGGEGGRAAQGGAAEGDAVFVDDDGVGAYDGGYPVVSAASRAVGYGRGVDYYYALPQGGNHLAPRDDDVDVVAGIFVVVVVGCVCLAGRVGDGPGQRLVVDDERPRAGVHILAAHVRGRALRGDGDGAPVHDYDGARGPDGHASQVRARRSGCGRGCGRGSLDGGPLADDGGGADGEGAAVDDDGRRLAGLEAADGAVVDDDFAGLGRDGEAGLAAIIPRRRRRRCCRRLRGFMIVTRVRVTTAAVVVVPLIRGVARRRGLRLPHDGGVLVGGDEGDGVDGRGPGAGGLDGAGGRGLGGGALAVLGCGDGLEGGGVAGGVAGEGRGGGVGYLVPRHRHTWVEGGARV